MSVLVDSCVLIDFLSGREAARDYLRGTPHPTISLITWMEVMCGAHTPEDERAIRSFLTAFTVLPVDEAVAEAAVSLRRLRRLKLPDALIWATARVHGLTLATRNTRDFGADEPGVVLPYPA